MFSWSYIQKITATELDSLCKRGQLRIQKGAGIWVGAGRVSGCSLRKKRHSKQESTVCIKGYIMACVSTLSWSNAVGA